MKESKELQIECTGCSNFCALRIQVKQGEIIHMEGNCCHRAMFSAKRQLERLYSSPTE